MIPIENNAGNNLGNSPPTLTPFSSLNLSPGQGMALSLIATDPDGDAVTFAVTGGSQSTISVTIDDGIDQIFSAASPVFIDRLTQAGISPSEPVTEETISLVTGAFNAASAAAQAKALELGIPNHGPTDELIDTVFLAAITSGSSPNDAINAAVQAAKAFVPDMILLQVANSFQNQSLTLNVTATDINGATTVETIFISVGAGGPVAVNNISDEAIEAGAGITGVNGSGNVLANDTGDGITLTAIRTGSAEGSGTAGTVGSPIQGNFGTLTINSSGNYTYEVNNSNTTVNALQTGQTLTESFNYTITNQSGSDTGVLEIEIKGSNDAPIAVGDTATATEGTASQAAVNATGNVLTNDSDAETGNLVVSSVVSAVTGTTTSNFGTITMASNGAFTYVVNDSNTTVDALGTGQTLTDTFTYTLADSQGATTSANLVITINGVTDQAGPRVVGYYNISNGQGNSVQIQNITDAGHTPQNMTTLSATELSQIDVLYVNNPSNSNHTGGGSEYVNAMPAIEAFVASGKVLIYHDRNVRDIETILPGNNGITSARDFGESRAIDILDNTTLVTDGPGGVLNDTSLDNGGSSNHGFVHEASLPAGAVKILSSTTDSKIITFSYAHGDGHAIYSTIPLDHYLRAGSGQPKENLREVYAPNVIAYAAELVDPIVLDLDGDGLEFIHLQGNSVDFSMDPTGTISPNDWLSPDDGFLVFDKNENNKVDDITELFSEFFADGVSSGMEALKIFDENNDGVIDSKDSLFSKLLIWQDKNSDGKTDQGELNNISDFGINSLNLASEDAFQIVGDSVLLSSGNFETEDGEQGTLGEVAFSVTNDDKSDIPTVDLGSISSLQIADLERLDTTNNSNERTIINLEDILTSGNTPRELSIFGDKGDDLVINSLSEKVELSSILMEGSVEATKISFEGTSTTLFVDNDISVSINQTSLF